MSDPGRIPADVARLMFVHGHGLLDDPTRPAPRREVLGVIKRLGFVQVDSIYTVERAHHHIIWSRLHAYRPTDLAPLHRSGAVFEGWTHDAAIIPTELYRQWGHRFAARRESPSAWLRQRMGDEYQHVLEVVLDRIRREGPLLAREFEHSGGRNGPWWDWKPAKAALEHLWRSGSLAIARRGGAGGFEKVYDLVERVLPGVHPARPPERGTHVAWACRTALDRLGTATPRELAAFWGLLEVECAAQWCRAEAAKGRIVPVEVSGCGDGPPRHAFAFADWRRRAELAAEAPMPRGIRILSPFDPIVRDRARCARLFGFDYRFEAYVPEPKRRFGYYVLPIIECGGRGVRIVGRLDPKLDRDRGRLSVRGLWWEPEIKATKARLRDLSAALVQYAAFLGADRVELPAEPKPAARQPPKQRASPARVPSGASRRVVDNRPASP
ncbi:MAG: YcaQ family DNA glycosylase [Phycisphaeraceae bacterium]|nr:YcaQ family DNA glycosylase [Phycisphaeraceae bacterium]